MSKLFIGTGAIIRWQYSALGHGFLFRVDMCQQNWARWTNRQCGQNMTAPGLCWRRIVDSGPTVQRLPRTLALHAFLCAPLFVCGCATCRGGVTVMRAAEFLAAGTRVPREVIESVEQQQDPCSLLDCCYAPLFRRNGLHPVRRIPTRLWFDSIFHSHSKSV